MKVKPGAGETLRIPGLALVAGAAVRGGSCCVPPGKSQLQEGRTLPFVRECWDEAMAGAGTQHHSCSGIPQVIPTWSMQEPGDRELAQILLI